MFGCQLHRRRVVVFAQRVGGADLGRALGRNGSWAIQATPNPTGAADTLLEAVSCPTATACTAVGITTSPTSNPAAVAEAWNGVTWVVQPTSSPAKAQATELSGVSCVTAAACTAVGHWNYNALNSAGQTLAEHK